jgi:hypothetical protein
VRAGVCSTVPAAHAYSRDSAAWTRAAARPSPRALRRRVDSLCPMRVGQPGVHVSRRVAVCAGQPPGRREGRKPPVEREAGCAPGGRAMRAPLLARACPFVQRGSLFLCAPPEG